MSHRAQTAVDAIAAVLSANANLKAAVFTDRTLTMSEAEQELPAVVVSMGADRPFFDVGVVNTTFIDSLLEVNVDAYCTGDREADIRDALLELRRQIHIAVMADVTLAGVAMNTRYGGAAAVQWNTEGTRLVGLLSSSWIVHYRMNVGDPA